MENIQNFVKLMYLISRVFWPVNSLLLEKGTTPVVHHVEILTKNGFAVFFSSETSDKIHTQLNQLFK